MQLINREIQIAHPRDEVKIVAMGCVHHGAFGCDEKLADFWYKKILSTPNMYAIFGGDMVDSIHEKDKRYSEGEVADWCLPTKANRAKWGNTLIERQRTYALDKWKALAAAGKVLWIHAGNHEDKLVARDSVDLTGYWAQTLGIPYAGLAALSNLFVKSHGKTVHRVTLFTTHGGGSSVTPGARLNKVASLLHGYDVDIALMWHLHFKTHLTQTMLGISDTGRRKVRNRVGAMCGTFLDGHKEGINSYAELKGYSPTNLGPIVVHIKREIGDRPSSDPDRATGYTRIWVSDAITED